MELTFSHKLVLDSLHSHDPYLERNHHPSSLQIIFLIDGLGCTKMVKILTPPKCNSWIPKLWISWFYGVIKFPYEFRSKNFILQSCDFGQDLSNAMLHTSIKGHLIHVHRFYLSIIKLWIWFMTFLLAMIFNSKLQIMQNVNPLLIFTLQDLYNNILGI